MEYVVDVAHLKLYLFVQKSEHLLYIGSGHSPSAAQTAIKHHSTNLDGKIPDNHK